MNTKNPANFLSVNNNLQQLPNITRQFSMVFSSDTTTGAYNVSAGNLNAGSEFSVNLPQPISIPVKAKSCEISVSEFIGWWTMYNIFQDVNDTFKFTMPISGINTIYTLVIPPGIYDLSTLGNAIARGYYNQSPAPILGSFPLQFLSDVSTQRVVIAFIIDGVSVDFTVEHNMRNILGFYGSSSVWSAYGQYNQDIIPDPAIYPDGSTIGLSVYANQIASFNRINSLLVNCSQLGASGIPVNSSAFYTISNPKIQVPVGSQIVYTPFNPPIVNADHLIGRSISNLIFTLTDQSGRAVNTSGDTWSINVNFKYVL